MAIKVTDPFEFQLAFSDVTEVHSEPPDTAQFQGGYEQATILIDYKLSSTGGDPTAKLTIDMFNARLNNGNGGFVPWEEISLDVGEHSLKFSIAGRSGGLRIYAIGDAKVDWLYFAVSAIPI